MFSKLVSRNSKRNRKENGLFFGSMLAAIIVFYIILALPRQDVMIFLSKMESDAVNKLMSMIPVFYGMALVILFFLIYYASRFQMERRKHEFGVYLILGMRRSKLFTMLLAEDLRNSLILLAVGLPVSLMLSELISLITARLVGISIVGHQVSFSLEAMFWTAGGFLLIKFAAFLILSGKISRQEIDSRACLWGISHSRDHLPDHCLYQRDQRGSVDICPADDSRCDVRAGGNHGAFLGTSFSDRPVGESRKT